MDGGGVVREIKFRAYQPEAKGDLKWWSWQELRESDLNTIFRHPEQYHLMQYTGLKDKNGVEIYEGDIVRNELYEVFLVEYWGEHWFGYVLVQTDETWCGHLYEYDEYEVIGNIYDNPEMLEVS